MGNGLFSSTTYNGDGTVDEEKQFTLRSSGSFVAAEPYGAGDLNYNNRTPVAIGHIVNVDPTTTYSSATAEDASATKYFQGATIESQEDLSAFATDSGGVRISNSESAKSALTVIQAALDQLHIERASLGAIQQRIEFTSQQMIASQQNLSEAKSRITDVDMAAETTEYAKQQILVQSGTQMLREANRLPQTALELLR